MLMRFSTIQLDTTMLTMVIRQLLIWSRKLELQIKGAEKPTVWGLLGVRFILLPYTVGKWRICERIKAQKIVDEIQ
ncbi:dnaJ protein ERDJ7-like [Primulina huaijiensis]|uniref:dnaJ protein ERDJ7-like n=1 Tax=Primulina huaijiensis TaxID=1492673 RepID=UPI003CC72B55